MLVLTRKVDEVICIGDDIRIMLIRTRRNEAVIGIEAPKQVHIFREELALIPSKRGDG